MKNKKYTSEHIKIVDLVEPNIYVDHRHRSDDYPLHMHNFFELEFFLDGNAENEINGINHKIVPGSLFLYNRSDFHQLHNVTRTLDYYYMGFDWDLFSKCKFAAEISNNFPIIGDIPYKSSEFLKFSALFQSLHQEYTDNMPNKTLYITYNIELIMLIIFRMIKSNSSVISKNIPQKALIYIQKNFTNEINLKTIAEQIPCSPNYLSSLFYKTYKKGISEYINDMRLTYAYNLLQIDPSLPAMEVCYRSGYKSYSHFSNSFKNKFGFSPKKVAKSVTSTINLSSNDYKK